MTAKSRKFPLPLSSLDSKSSSRTGKSGHPVQNIATPQTATQNARHQQSRSASVPVTRCLLPRVPDHATPFRSEIMAQHKPADAATAYEAPRRAMVARLVRQGIADPVVLAAMGTVPRHLFIESGLVGQAYIDASLPIGYEQTISQPYIVARMIEVMRNGKSLKNVLEIGTGCGYQAAVLAQLCENVYSIERIKLLHELAKKNLRSLRIANLRLHYGDGMRGLPEVAPFDGIILAAAGMQIPDALLQQLAIGGRLIAPVGEKQQVLQLIERTGNADWTKTVLEGCYFVPLRPGII